MALKKFKIVKVVPGKIGTLSGIVDLSNIDDDVAEKLFDQKCPYIERVEETKKENK